MKYFFAKAFCKVFKDPVLRMLMLKLLPQAVDIDG